MHGFLKERKRLVRSGQTGSSLSRLAECSPTSKHGGSSDESARPPSAPHPNSDLPTFLESPRMYKRASATRTSAPQPSFRPWLGSPHFRAFLFQPLIGRKLQVPRPPLRAFSVLPSLFSQRASRLAESAQRAGRVTQQHVRAPLGPLHAVVAAVRPRSGDPGCVRC